MKKHIVLYINSMQTSGGIERVVATLAEKLAGAYKISILVKDEPVSFYNLPTQVHIETLNCPLYLNMHNRLSRIWTLWKHLWLVKKKLKVTFQQLNADYIYVTTPYACLETALARIPRQQVIISEHGSRINYNIIYRFLKFILYKKYPVQIVPTQHDYKWYKKHGYPSVYIPHFRSNLPYTKNQHTSKIILNIGRLTNDKNQLALLRIWEKVYQLISDKEWKLRIVGDGENSQILRQYVINHNMTAIVDFAGPSSHVERHYQEASIYVSTSQSEGFPMVLIEAISFGLPVIAYDCPTGPAEILQDDSGILINLHDETTYIKKLYELIETPELRQRLSDRAFEHAQNWADSYIISTWNQILK